jgi:hypothetical protein
LLRNFKFSLHRPDSRCLSTSSSFKQAGLKWSVSEVGHVYFMTLINFRMEMGFWII